MAPLALFLTLVFIGWLLVRDSRQRASVSAAVWIPTLLLLILGSRPLSLWLGGTSVTSTMEDGAGGSLIDQVFYLSVIVGGWIVASTRRLSWSKLFAANTSILLLYSYFAISVLWSGDPAGSFKRLSKDFGMVFVIAVIFSEKDPLEAVRAVFVRCACVLFPLSVVFIRYFPNMARSYSRAGEELLAGVTTQKNTLGEIILVFGLFLIWDCLEARLAGAKWLSGRMLWDRLALLAMGAWLLYMSQSKTALICLLIGAFLVLRRGRLASRNFSRFVLFVALSLPFLMFSVQQFSSVIAPLVEAVGRDVTFTGRTDIWEHISLATVNPLVGSGYWNFWGGKGGLAISEAMQTTVPNAHCGYLDIFLDGGMVGLFLLFSMLVVCANRLIRTPRTNRYQQVRFALVIVMVIYNLSESTFVRLSPTWVATLLVLIDFPFIRANGTMPEVSPTALSEDVGLAIGYSPQDISG